MENNIYCLHGFFGKPRDWDFLYEDKTGNLPKNCKFIFPDLFTHPEFGPHVELSQWGKKFNHWVESRGIKNNYIVGYSMGGRLALHALLASPDLWQGAVIISAHYGLANEGDREARKRNDQVWQRKILTDNWTDLMKDWDAQPVFNTSSSQVERNETEFNRESLALALNNWTLSRQSCLLSSLKTIKKVIWVVGHNDLKAMELISSLNKQASQIKTIIIEDAGHRLLWEKGEQVRNLVIDNLIVK